MSAIEASYWASAGSAQYDDIGTFQLNQGTYTIPDGVCR